MNEKTVDIIKAVAAIILLTILNVYLPFFSLFVLIVWPIPIVITTVKHGVKPAGIVVTIAALISGFFFSPLMGLYAIIGFGFTGFVLGSSVNEDFSPFKILLFTIITVFISQTLILTISTQFLGYDIKQILDESMNLLLQTPQVDEMILTQVKALIKSIIPSIIFISATIVGIMNYYISMWYLNKWGIEKEVYRPVRFWRFPKWIISLGILFTLIYTQSQILLNINIILFFFAFLQGFGVGLYFVNKKANLFLTMVYVVLIFVIPVLPFALILVGLIDMWFDFRNIKRENN